MYEPTEYGEDRPPPPKPDTPNTGRVHRFEERALPVQVAIPAPPTKRDWLRGAGSVALIGIFLIEAGRLVF